MAEADLTPEDLEQIEAAKKREPTPVVGGLEDIQPPTDEEKAAIYKRVEDADESKRAEIIAGIGAWGEFLLTVFQTLK